MAHEMLMEARGLTRRYKEVGSLLKPRYTHAVQDVSLSIRKGETLGLVGESGCGKSTVARLLMALERPDSGEIFLNGQRIDDLPEEKLRPLRPKFQMVFQDSGSSLNPRKRVVDILTDPMVHHGLCARKDARQEAVALLSQVGLLPEALDRYPHEFSGGQRQRICIARALGLRPELLVLDEPVSALDVSVQAQILNLLRDLQGRLQLTCLFIGHGLGAVHYVSHRIAVMYMGRIVEEGDSESLFDHPQHPYTRALLDAAPSAEIGARDRERITLRGEARLTGGTGCPFRDRCPWAKEACGASVPALAPVPGLEDRLCACIRPGAERS